MVGWYYSLKGLFHSLLAVAIMFPYIRLPGVIPDVSPELIIVLVVWCLMIMAYLTQGHALRLRLFTCVQVVWYICFCHSVIYYVCSF